MTPNEYNAALDKAYQDLEQAVETRDILNAQIAGLRETVRVLSSRVKLTDTQRREIGRLLDMAYSATPTLADSIRATLARAFPKGMTAVEMRNSLEESQFDFDDFSNPLSACHAALKRMHADEEVEIQETKDGKTAYRRVLKMTPPPRFAPDEMIEQILGIGAAKIERTVADAICLSDVVPKQTKKK